MKLVGSALPDAIVLQPIDDNHTFYALVKAEDEDDASWEGMHLTCQGFITWARNVPFRLVLYFLSESSAGMVVSGPSLAGAPPEL